jgi:hypothetical protein
LTPLAGFDNGDTVFLTERPADESAAKLLTKDEARQIAANIAKLPGLLSEPFSHLFERAWSSSTRRVAL